MRKKRNGDGGDGEAWEARMFGAGGGARDWGVGVDGTV
jgi:hypothetical protein